MKKIRKEKQPINFILQNHVSLIAFIGLNIILLSIIFVYILPDYPTGWDAPYYISRIQYFLEQDVLSNRVGLILLVSTLHLLTGISVISLITFVPVVATTLLALASALLASRVAKNNKFIFPLVFFFVFWSTSYFALSISTIDNAIGLSFAIFSLYLLSFGMNSIKKIIPFTLSATMVVLTHFESYMLLLLCLFFYFVILLIQEKSIKTLIKNTWRGIVAIVVTMAIAYFQWSNIISNITNRYTQEGDSAGNASIPYADTTSFEQVWKYFSNGLSSAIEIFLFLFGISFVIWSIFRKKSNKAGHILAFVLSCYSILLFSIIRSSIPINRSLLLLPVTLMVSIGMVAVYKFIKTRFKVSMQLLVIAGLITVMFPISNYIEYVMRFPQSIRQETYVGLNQLNQHVQEENIKNYIVVTNTGSKVKAASAYYGLWRNWIMSVLPLPTESNNFCIYFGKLDNFRKKEATIRKDNEEYNYISQYSLECINELPSGTPIYMIKGLYPGSFPQEGSRFSTKDISENVVEIIWSDNSIGQL
jgi:hypothetical protein